MATTLQHITANLRDNPITRRETLTLERGRSKWFWRAAYLITAFILLAPFMDALFWGPFYPHLDNVVAILILVNIIVYPLAVIRTITTASQSMINERTGKTWDLLMLTGVGAWRLVLGKWLGTMRFMLRDYVWLFALRAGTFIWVIARINMEAAYGYQELRSMTSAVSVTDVVIQHPLFVPILLSIAGFLVLELMLSSALGLATSLFEWSRRAGNWTAIVIRIGVPIGFGLVLLYAVGLIGLGAYFNPIEYDDTAEATIMTVTTVLGDNASITNSWLTNDTDQEYMQEEQLGVAVGQFIGICLYLLWTGAALGAAAFVARRKGIALDALPTPAGFSKPKRKSKPQENTSPLPQRAERRIRAAAGVQNALGLENPAAYRVELFQYQRRTGRLYLRLTGAHETRYVQFSSVAHIDTPMQWTGANLRVASTHERDAFIAAHDITLNSLTADDMQLYMLNSQPPVHIIAGTITLLDDAPAHL